VIISGPLLFNEEELCKLMAVIPEVWGMTVYSGKVNTENELIRLLRILEGKYLI
jgi:hypothetical protein